MAATTDEAKLYRWFEHVARANNLVKPVTDKQYQSKLWIDRYEKTRPAYIAHDNYGPCLVHAQRREQGSAMFPGRVYYLISLVTPVDDASLRESRQGFFQVPESVAIEGKNGTEIVTFLFMLKCIITEFVYVNPQEDSSVVVYDGETYTRMLLSEFRRHTDIENDSAFRIAFDAFKQSNPDFIRKHDVGAPAVVTPAADARLIMSRLPRTRSTSMRYALAFPSLRQSLEGKDARKGQKHVDARIAEPLHDPHGVIAHLVFE